MDSLVAGLRREALNGAGDAIRQLEQLIDPGSALLELRQFAAAPALATAIGKVGGHLHLLSASRDAPEDWDAGTTEKFNHALGVVERLRLPGIHVLTARGAAPKETDSKGNTTPLLRAFAAAARHPQTLVTPAPPAGAIATLAALADEVVVVAGEASAQPSTHQHHYHIARDPLHALHVARTLVRWPARPLPPVTPGRPAGLRSEPLTAADLARQIVDEGRLDIFRAAGRNGLLASGRLLGRPFGIMVTGGDPADEEVETAAGFLVRAGARRLPLLLLQHGGGGVTGAPAAAMLSALARLSVPRVMVLTGGHGTAGAREHLPFRPDFLWEWPHRDNLHADKLHGGNLPFRPVTAGADGLIAPEDTRMVAALSLEAAGQRYRRGRHA